MVDTLITALRAALVTLVLTGLLYPLATTGLAEMLFPQQANGSLVADDRGALVGSELIGQRFADAAYFQPRPSAAGALGYDPQASGGSNLATSSQRLRQRTLAEAERLRAENPVAPEPVPAELVLASASGLDPEISPEAARWQLRRIARARRVAFERIQSVLEGNVEGRDLGFLGEPRVNVLMLNLALDMQLGKPVLRPPQAKVPPSIPPTDGGGNPG